MINARFVEKLFSQKDLYKFSPIVIWASDESAIDFISDLFARHNIKTHCCSVQYEIDDNLPVAFLALQDIEKDLSAQERLAKFIDFGKLSQQTVFVITQKHINDLYLLGKLRARLLSRVYTEL